MSNLIKLSQTTSKFSTFDLKRKLGLLNIRLLAPKAARQQNY